MPISPPTADPNLVSGKIARSDSYSVIATPAWRLPHAHSRFGRPHSWRGTVYARSYSTAECEGGPTPTVASNGVVHLSIRQIWRFATLGLSRPMFR
jgi:hypothetical protein